MYLLWEIAHNNIAAFHSIKNLTCVKKHSYTMTNATLLYNFSILGIRFYDKYAFHYICTFVILRDTNTKFQSIVIHLFWVLIYLNTLKEIPVLFYQNVIYYLNLQRIMQDLHMIMNAIPFLIYYPYTKKYHNIITK